MFKILKKKLKFISQLDKFKMHLYTIGFWMFVIMNLICKRSYNLQEYATSDFKKLIW